MMRESETHSTLPEKGAENRELGTKLGGPGSHYVGTAGIVTVVVYLGMLEIANSFGVGSADTSWSHSQVRHFRLYSISSFGVDFSRRKLVFSRQVRLASPPWAPWWVCSQSKRF